MILLLAIVFVVAAIHAVKKFFRDEREYNANRAQALSSMYENGY